MSGFASYKNMRMYIDQPGHNIQPSRHQSFSLIARQEYYLSSFNNLSICNSNIFYCIDIDFLDQLHVRSLSKDHIVVALVQPEKEIENKTDLLRLRINYNDISFLKALNNMQIMFNYFFCNSSSHDGALMPLRSQTIFPARMVNSASSFCVPFSFVLRMSRNPKSPLRKLNTAISASEPTLKFPRSGLLITFAGFQVERKMTSCKLIPMLRNLDITLLMSFIPLFILSAWRSVLITFGRKPCCIAGTACRQEKAPPPWPTSKMIPLFCASKYKWFHFAVFINNSFSDCRSV